MAWVTAALMSLRSTIASAVSASVARRTSDMDSASLISPRCASQLGPDSTLIAVIEMSQSSWLVAAIVPGIERHPLKKLEASEEALLQLLRRWQGEAAGAGRTIARVAVAFEAGRDGFWLARWLRAHGIEAYPA